MAEKGPAFHSSGMCLLVIGCNLTFTICQKQNLRHLSSISLTKKPRLVLALEKSKHLIIDRSYQ